MKVLVTGASGQLGQELQIRAPQYTTWEFFFCDRSELDITNKEAVERVVLEKNITAIVNCAAYTAVDKAESEQELAYSINVIGAQNLARVASENQLQLIHVSTDFVFDGIRKTPYTESDSPNPIGVYGKTKLQGEEEILKVCPKAIVLRTAWLYSAFGANFVKTMQRLGKERTQLRVVSDQIGTPTWAGDLGDVLLEMLAKLENGGTQKGVYHYSNEGVASWYDFAVEIMKLSQIDCEVLPIETKDYPLPAPRPAYSVLNKSKIKRDFGLIIPDWKASLEKCIELIEQKSYTN